MEKVKFVNMRMLIILISNIIQVVILDEIYLFVANIVRKFETHALVALSQC